MALRAVEGLYGPPVPAEPADAAEPAEPEPTSKWRRLLKKMTPKIDKASLTKLGGSMFLSYGFVSNVNAALLIVISWATFRTANPALAPFMLTPAGPIVLPSLHPKFLIVYAGYYATIGTILRPVRFIVASALSPAFSRVIKALRERFGFNQTVAVGTVVFFANFVTTWIVIVVGVYLACLIVGVPVFPPPVA